MLKLSVTPSFSLSCHAVILYEDWATRLPRAFFLGVSLMERPAQEFISILFDM